MIEHIEQLGLRSHVIVGTERTVVAALGEKRDGAKQALETLEGVEKVVPILAPYKMASTEVKKEPTVVEVARPARSAAATSASSPGRARSRAASRSSRSPTSSRKRARPACAAARSSRAPVPYSFQGLKEKGLELLAEAREATGLAVVTEVMAPEQVELVSRYADVLQVGARNMQNYPLLEAVGESALPVLLKRGPSATMDEFLLAAEYILKTGNTQRHAVRARHPHLRGPHALHAAAGDACRICIRRRTCRSSSIPATAPARRAWWRRWRGRRSRPGRMA